jgi:hypothetical protein
MPFRRKITTVVGRPIDVPEKIEKPTEEQINQLHDIYVNELIQLYNDHKDKYLEDESATSFMIV